MKRFASATAIAGLVVAGAVVTAPSAWAGDRTCRGTLGKITVDGNVKVPTGKTCTLKGTKVKGNVIVGSRATLRAYSARIDGNLEGYRYNHVTSTSSYVDGNIQLKSAAASTCARTSSTATSRSSATSAARSTSTTTASTATFSASPTPRPPRALATRSRATRRVSAAASDLLTQREGGRPGIEPPPFVCPVRRAGDRSGEGCG